MRLKPEVNACGIAAPKYQMRQRERIARSLTIPAWSRAKLEAEGIIKGRTWRDMPAQNDFGRACAWWLWKRGLLNLTQEHEEARAFADFAQHTA